MVFAAPIYAEPRRIQSGRFTVDNSPEPPLRRDHRDPRARLFGRTLCASECWSPITKVLNKCHFIVIVRSQCPLLHAPASSAFERTKPSRRWSPTNCIILAAGTLQSMGPSRKPVSTVERTVPISPWDWANFIVNSLSLGSLHAAKQQSKRQQKREVRGFPEQWLDGKRNSGRSLTRMFFLWMLLRTKWKLCGYRATKYPVWVRMRKFD